MNKTKKTIVALLAVLVLLVAALMGLMVVNARCYVIDGRLYAKDAESLDLRGREISVEHYETVRSVLPDCEILWDVPLKAGAYACDSREAAVAEEGDLALLDYFSGLEVLDVRQWQDFVWTAELREKYPDMKFLFETGIGGNVYTHESREMEIASITEEELALLPSMENLEQVTVTEGGDATHFMELKTYCEDNDIDFRVILFGQEMTESTEELELSNATDNQVQLMMLLPWLEKIHLTEPEAEAASLLSLRDALPETEVIWEKTVMGLTFSSEDTEIDLTDVIALDVGQELGEKTAYQYALEQPVMGDREENPSSGRIVNGYPIPDKFDQTEELLAEAEAAMAYFPNAEKLVMCGAWLNDEAMAEYREEHRAEYKTVWSVRCGPLATRTDATFFMPTKYQVAYGAFTDLDAYNLRYCEDMECIDIGHFIVANIDFAAFMPNLKYLDLSWTVCNDLTPLVNCKKLEFFEINWINRYIDYTPLQECTGLKDLNISQTGGDIDPILEMTWLENLWIVGFDEADYRAASEALPDTYIGYYYANPVNGWRQLPNYYAMRDAMLMFYMS